MTGNVLQFVIWRNYFLIFLSICFNFEISPLLCLQRHNVTIWIQSDLNLVKTHLVSKMSEGLGWAGLGWRPATPSDWPTDISNLYFEMILIENPTKPISHIWNMKSYSIKYFSLRVLRVPPYHPDSGLLWNINSFRL